MNRGEVRAQLVATLTAAGIRATADPRNVNPPCVVVGRVEGARITGCAYEGSVAVSVVAPGAGHADASEWLDVTSDQVAALLVATTTSPDVYPMPGQTTGLLCDVLTVPVVWEATAP